MELRGRRPRESTALRFIQQTLLYRFFTPRARENPRFFAGTPGARTVRQKSSPGRLSRPGHS